MGHVVAIMNAHSVLARDLIEVLSADEPPEWIEELRLFGRPDDSFIRFGARDLRIETWSAERMRDVDIALCGGAREVQAGAVAVAVADGPADPEIPVVLDGVNLDDVEEHRGTVHVPTGAAAAVALLTRALGGVTRVSGSVLLPATSLGPKAMEELYAQTLALFNHQPLPTEVLGDRLAFNVLPGVERLFGLGSLVSAPAHLQSLLVPVFGGTTLALTLDLDDATDVASRLEAAPGIEVWDEPHPADVIGSADVRVAMQGEASPLTVLAVVDEVRREAIAMLAAAREVSVREAF